MPDMFRLLNFCLDATFYLKPLLIEYETKRTAQLRAG